MTPGQRSRRTVALAAAVSVWLAIVAGRALGLLHWPWLWVLAPYWLGVAALLVFTVVCLLATVAIRFYVWLVVRADCRRRERERRQFRHAMDSGLRDMVGSRTLHFRDETRTRKLRP